MPSKVKNENQFNIIETAMKHLEALLEIPASINNCDDVADYVQKCAQIKGFKSSRQLDNSVHIFMKGTNKDKRVVGYGAHMDRIALMVSKLHDDGRIEFIPAGGLWPGHLMEGVVAEVHTSKGILPGVISHIEAPIHSLGIKEFENRPQKFEKLRLRLDALVGCDKKEGKNRLEKLGVRRGQMIFPQTNLHIDRKNKTVRSRWLDNTLGCIALLTVMDWVHAEKNKLKFDMDLIFSVAEEAGKGGSSVHYPELTDFISVDVSIGEKADSMKDALILQNAGHFPYYRKLVDELETAARKSKALHDYEVLVGGGTDAEQARVGGFKGRIASLCTPVYGMHSIETATFDAIESVIKIIHAHGTK